MKETSLILLLQYEIFVHVPNSVSTVHVLPPADSDDKPNIWQMKKKERKDFRRKQDGENYDLVHSLKQLYETIRRFVYFGCHHIMIDSSVKHNHYSQLSPCRHPVITDKIQPSSLPPSESQDWKWLLLLQTLTITYSKLRPAGVRNNESRLYM